jgi:hypothetical protein
MNLIWKYNVGASEYDMQKAVSEYFRINKYTQQSGYFVEEINPLIYREVGIPTLGRISDIIVKVTDRKVFNIECKINDTVGVIEQAIDHLSWANYSYICIHSMTYIPTRDIQRMIDNGIGLLMYQNAHQHWDDKTRNRPEALMDVIGASPSKQIDKTIREAVFAKLKKLDSQRTAQSHKQLTIEP